MQARDEATVLFVNEAFYRAFAARDFDIVRALWSDQTDIACIHPGWAPLHGRRAVLQSWAVILRNLESTEVSCRAARVHFLAESVACVTCYEVLGEAGLTATNVFVREADAWRLVHHHASPCNSPPPPADDGPPMRMQ